MQLAEKWNVKPVWSITKNVHIQWDEIMYKHNLSMNSENMFD